MFSDYIYQWLDNSLDCGISEADFWQMTIAELDRAFKSYKRVRNAQQQERANFDYMLADLIGRSVARIHSSSAKMPEITEAYPTIFNTEEIEDKKAARLDELSALKFKLFAEANNKKFAEGAAKD